MTIFLISDLAVRGGTHKQLLKLIEYYDEQNIDFKIITNHLDFNNTYTGFLKYKNKINIIEQIKSKSISYKIKNYFRYSKLLKKAISDGDIINIHDGGFEKYLGVFKGKKVYWQINDLHSCFQEGVSNNRINSLYNKLLKLYIKSKVSIITEFTVNVSKNAERIKKHLNRNAFVFYCGVDALGFLKDNEKTIQRFKERKINLLTSGVFFPYRNYETQINVVKILIAKGVNVSLNIFGSTNLDLNYSNKIKKIIEDERLSNNIKVLGQIDDVMYRDLHNNSDLFLFVNVDQSWGLAVFEAMSCGLPVIVSESVGATEILHNGIDSIFVNPINEMEIANNIVNIIENENKYLELSNYSFQFHIKHSWNQSYCSKMLSLMLENKVNI